MNCTISQKVITGSACSKLKAKNIFKIKREETIKGKEDTMKE